MAGRSSASRLADAGSKASGSRRSASCCSKRCSSGRSRPRFGSPGYGGSACGRPVRQLRALAIAYVVLLAIVIVAQRQGLLRHADLSGAVRRRRRRVGGWLKRPSRARHRDRRRRRSGGLFTAPIALPILPPDALVAYMQATGFSPKATQTESMKLADAAAIFRRHVRLARDGGGGLRRLSRPAARRARAGGVLRAQLRRGGRARRLWPGARRPAGDQRPQFLFPLGAARRFGRGRHHAGPRRRAASAASTTTFARSAASTAAYAMPYENGLTIWVLRQPRAPLAEVWGALKHYD